MAEGETNTGTPEGNTGETNTATKAASLLTLLDKPQEKPGWLDDKDWNTEEKTFSEDFTMDNLVKLTDKLHDNATFYRKKISEGEQKAPEKPEDYKIPEGITDAEENTNAIEALRKYFHSFGASQHQFEKAVENIELLSGLQPQEGEQQPKLTQEELDAQTHEEHEKLGADREKILVNVKGLFETFEGMGLHDNIQDLIERATITAEDNKFWYALAMHMNEIKSGQFANIEVKGPDNIRDIDLRLAALVRDPNFKKENAEGRALRAEYDEKMELKWKGK